MFKCSNLLQIIRYTFLGNVRNKIFMVLILFGFILLCVSILFSLLGQEQEIRMLLDLGLASIEFLSLLISVFLMTNLLLEEIQSKTIYLILTRTTGKMEYLLGRYLGTILAIFCCILMMTLMHVGLLTFKGWEWQKDGILYLTSVFMSFEKILLISALGLLFSLYSSSGAVALTFTVFFWVLGHFAMELKFLSEKVQGDLAQILFKGVYFIIPHFQYMNARDLWISVSDRLPSFIIQGTFYTLLYSSLSLGLALLLFRKKEF